MLVKKWNFTGAGTSGHAVFPYAPGEYVDQPGEPGQGNPNPPGAFDKHFIVELAYRDAGGNWIEGIYYDPSYGGSSYGGATKNEAHAKWEDASLDGFTQDFLVWDPVLGAWVLQTFAKKNDTGAGSIETILTPV